MLARDDGYRRVRRDATRGLDPLQRLVKRSFDLAVSTLLLTVTFGLIVVVILLASIDTRSFGIFSQRRVGLHGRTFRVYKIRTMRTGDLAGSTVTIKGDPRVTRLGRFLRRYKIDELPQLFNVVRGEMSFVGPRPDVPGYADSLEGEDRIILSVRPGITGPATLRFRDEESELAEQPDPEAYNREVIWKEKVRLNRRYVEEYSLTADLRIILATLVPALYQIDEGATGDSPSCRGVTGER